MSNITFDVEKLNKNDRKIYEAMTDAEKANFERTWVAIESQKIRLQQYKNHSKERNAREKRVQAEKDRKERTHHMIVLGAILDSAMPGISYFSDKEISDILYYVFSLEDVSSYIEGQKNKFSASGDQAEGSDLSEDLYGW